MLLWRWEEMIGRTLFYFMGMYSSKGVCPPFPTHSFFCGVCFFNGCHSGGSGWTLHTWKLSVLEPVTGNSSLWEENNVAIKSSAYAFLGLLGNKTIKTNQTKPHRCWLSRSLEVDYPVSEQHRLQQLLLQIYCFVTWRSGWMVFLQWLSACSSVQFLLEALLLWLVLSIRS